MSVNSLSSLVYQPLLPHVEVVEQEIVHQWDVNDFIVCLIKKQGALEKDILEYKTIKNQIEIYTEYIEIPESKNIERMISQLKTCKVMLDENGIATFSRSYHTWENTPNLNAECEYHDTEISLIRGSEGLVWSVFQRITKESSFYSLQEATIPSLRCHPKTIALIEKIKTEGLSNALLLDHLMHDFKVRVISPKDLLKEYEALAKSYNERMR